MAKKLHTTDNRPTDNSYTIPQWVGNILNFWFKECSPSDWYASKPEFDLIVKQRFHNLLLTCAVRPPSSVYEDANSALAIVILFDQFSRNIYRGNGNAFAYDALAHSITDNAINKGLDLQLTNQQRSFLYLPFMHDEKIASQERALALFTALGNEEGIKFAQKHYNIIKKFGRYPHRNQALGRVSTPQELEYLTAAERFGQ